MGETGAGRRPKQRKPKAVAPTALESAQPGKPSDFTLVKAIFEIGIVAIGVLLALLVDQARQSRADRALAEEARNMMRSEIEQNRVRIASKLSLLHNAHQAVTREPGVAPSLVDQGANFQITLTNVGWTTAIQTGALRLLQEEERQALAYIYNSHEIYNQLLSEEMTHWTALASGPEEGRASLWKAYARRVAVGGCISTIRIERFLKPNLPAEPLRQTCQRYRPSTPPQQLYRALGFPMPNTNWRPGGEFQD